MKGAVVGKWYEPNRDEAVIHPLGLQAWKVGGSIARNCFTQRNFFTVGANTSRIHLVKNCLLTQALLLDLHITFNLVFRMVDG